MIEALSQRLKEKLMHWKS